MLVITRVGAGSAGIIFHVSAAQPYQTMLKSSLVATGRVLWVSLWSTTRNAPHARALLHVA